LEVEKLKKILDELDKEYRDLMEQAFGLNKAGHYDHEESLRQYAYGISHAIARVAEALISLQEFKEVGVK